ncbi:PspA/IM30 family protein [Flavobacterium selenitireducens]|uniref:PspA/IM30 family protein n=1 Tax=Flavobacterium selenitireducens TaxID=2722704 RepID=UPI00168BA0B6|nr:PspA/IM30 family protein [Flavobacterium selenitireducens]MBD3581748.1 PspA/IM30 family protein [Flavobacterium selenitireducens]
MKFLRRLFKIGQAEVHHAIDNMEDPIKMTEQGIRDMKEDLDKALEALAQVKAMSIRAKKEVGDYEEKAEDYNEKAMLLLKKAQNGGMEPAEADRLATEALVKKEEAIQLKDRAISDKEKFDQNVLQMEGNVQTIKQNISKWENELKILRSRVKVADATKSLNKQMARIDGNGTIALLERMKEKVNQEEALAEAYGDIANSSKSIDAEINKAVDVKKSKANSELEKLKEQLGINGKND